MKKEKKSNLLIAIIIDIIFIFIFCFCLYIYKNPQSGYVVSTGQYLTKQNIADNNLVGMGAALICFIILTISIIIEIIKRKKNT